MKFVFFIFVLMLTSSSLADDEQLYVRVVRGVSGQAIQGLELKDVYPVSPVRQDKKGRPYVKLHFHGSFLERGSFLLASERAEEVLTPSTDESSFSYVVYLTRIETRLLFRAIDPTGRIKEETVSLILSGLDSSLFSDAKKADKADKTSFFRSVSVSPGLGVSAIQYKESYRGGGASFSENAITAKLSLLHESESKWSMGANVFVTALPLSMSLEGVTVRFLGVNGRVGYYIPGVRTPWRLLLSVGGYYTTTFVTPRESLGYLDLSGPQLFPVLSYLEKSGKTTAAYLKFSPVGAGFSLETLDNHEWAFGVTRSWPFAKNRTFSITLDIAILSLYLPDADDFRVNTTSVSLGGTIGL